MHGIAAGLLLGAVAATVAPAGEVALGLRRLDRVRTRPDLGRLAFTVGVLVASAALEELLFRVALLGLLTRVLHLPDPVAIAVAALVFGPPHLVRGSNTPERTAGVVTATAFGLLLGTAWLVWGFAVGWLVAFHAAFNVTGGIVLGAAALDPLSPRLGPTPVWPWRQRVGPRPDASAARRCLPELVTLAAVGLLLAPRP